MNTGLGGFKNMLRRWRINLKKKKKKLANEKITKYYRMQSIFYSMIAIVYYPIGLMLNSKNDYKIAKQEQPKLYKTINDINKTLDEMVINYDVKRSKNISKIDKETIKIKKELLKPMSNEAKQYFEDKINEVTIKNNYLKKPSKSKSIIAKVNNCDLKKENVKEGSKKENSKSKIENSVITSNIIKDNQKYELKENVLEESNLIEQNKLQNKDISENLKEDVVGVYIKDTTKQIKEYEEELNKIKENITLTDNYNSLYELEHKLSYIRKKIEKLKDEYKFLKEKYEFKEYDFDKYELHKNDKKLDNMIDNIEKQLKEINLKKYEIYYKKEEHKVENRIEEKKELTEKEQEKKEKIYSNVIAKEMILSNISKQNEYFSFYMQQLEKSTNHKKTLFDNLLIFSKTILNFSLSLLPISILKNKALGTFVSTIMVNNSIKTMRRMANPDMDINYEIFIDKYYSNKELLLSSYFMCENSLQELDQLKDELTLLNYSSEAIELNKKIATLENHLLVQREDLKRKNGILDKVYVKVKKDA